MLIYSERIYLLCQFFMKQSSGPRRDYLESPTLNLL